MTPCRILAALLLPLTPTVHAATFTWPSTACPGTLQACINAAAAGDEVRIVTQATIDEAISINKSLRLHSRGTAARFAEGREMTLSATSGNVAITLENLWLYGRLNAQIGSAVAADVQSLTLTGVRIDNAIEALNAVRITASSTATSSHSVSVTRSRISSRSSSLAAIRVQLPDASGNGSTNISQNQITSRFDGIHVDLGAGRATISANEVTRRGTSSMVPYGIYARGAGAGGADGSVFIARNVVNGYDIGVFASASNSPLNSRIVNNTIVNSGSRAISIERAAPSHSARIANNLISGAACAIDYVSSAPTATADYNFFHNTTAVACGGASGGANDRTGTPQFVGGIDFRTRSGSPNRDAGNNADQPIVPIIVPVPTPDFDGRAGRIGGTVDMGAFEFSFDTSLEHLSRADNTFANVTNLTPPPAFALLNSDVLQLGQFGRDIDATPVLPSHLSQHLGVWWDNSRWTIFAQQPSASIALNRKFFALLNVDSNTSYVHTASAANILGNVSTLDHPELNNRPNALPIVTQHWDPEHDGTGIYNNASIGVWYDGTVSRWKVFNQLPSGGSAPPMPPGAAFNVLIPNALFAAGSHAYRSDALGVPVTILNLDHPLLNNDACAHPYVTASFNPNSVYVPANLVTSFNPTGDGRGNWAIERGDAAQIPAGATFHVYIDPQQSRRCANDLIFQDGFE
jgi:hypothetical protein